MTNQEIKKMAKDYWLPGKRNNDPSFDEVGFARAILSRAIPEGHVVVPKEPTPEMSAKGGLSVLRGYYSGMKNPDPDDIATAENAYSAMIAAAPANKEG